MTAPNLLESSEQAGLYLRGSDTLLASWEAYARGATGAAVHRLPGVARFAAWVHESDEPMRAELERRGYALDTTTRAMGMDLDDIALPRPPIDLGPADWPEYLRMDGLPPDFLSAADHAAFHLLAARVDGEMVAAALAYDFGDDCGIYNVGTVEKARRRGLGTALTTAQVLRRARPRLPDREPAVDPDGRARVRRRRLPRPRPHPGVRPRGRRAMMSEVRFAVGDADAGLAERLDKEISAFNAAVTGHHDGRMLSVAVRGDDGDLRAGTLRVDVGWVRLYRPALGARRPARFRPGSRTPGRRRSRDPAPRLRPGGPEHPLLPGRVSTPGSGTPNAAARRAIRTATTTSTW